MDSTKLKNQMRKFAEHLIVDKGLSQITVEGYSRCLSIALRRVRKFCPQPKDIKGHILWMHEKKYSYSHIVNTSLAFEHYAKLKGMRIRIGRPRKPRRIVKDTLSESEVSRLIQSAANARERAVVCLLAYSGIRNRELCALKVEDVDLGANQLAVLGGKNKKDGVVNISAECTRVLIDYLRQYPKERSESLFSTLAKNNPFAPGDVRKLLRTLARRAGIERRVFPHLLRHSLATNLLNRGASLVMIQKQLRHSFIDSTMIYAASMPFRNRSEYDFFKPAYM
jgi:integrase/recombinase XerD